MKLGDHIDSSEPGTVAPRILEAVQPEYPPKARRRRKTGRVVVAVYVDEQGKVVRTMILKKDDSGYGFNEAARKAAEMTRFQPATRDGIAGKMWTEIPYDFSLDG